MTGTLELTRCTLDLERGLVVPRERGPTVRLTTRERELLRYLAQRAPASVGREELHQRLWGFHESVLSRACDTTVRRLRAKIEVDPTEPRHLLTAHGTGYQLVPLGPAGVERPAAPATSPPAPEPARVGVALGPIRVDLDGLRFDGPDPGRITANEAALLRCLVEARGAVVERGRLSRAVWGQASAGRRLDHAVARLRSKVDPEARYLRTAIRGGYQLLLPREPTFRLPIEVDRRFGREPEVGELRDALDRARLVTLYGPGGIGKTRLALATAHALARDGHTVAWVAAAEARSLADLCTAAALAIETRLGSGDALDQIGRALASAAPLVLVLDNLEHLPDSHRAIAAWLTQVPDLRVLATSRVRLRLRGERPVAARPLQHADAVDLFLDRAVRAPPESELLEVDALVDELEGYPLAIELAAARTAVLSPSALRVREPLSVLTVRDPAREERLRSIRGSLEASYALLSPGARSVLAQLAPFHAPFTVDAYEAVVRADAPLDHLEELADWSLVRVDASGRFSLLPLVREFAAELATVEQRAEARARHGRWYGRTPDDLDGPREDEVRRALELDLPNHRAALAWALEVGDEAAAVGALESVDPVLRRHGPGLAALEAAEQVLAFVRSPGPRATALRVGAMAAVALRRLDRTRELLDEFAVHVAPDAVRDRLAAYRVEMMWYYRHARKVELGVVAQEALDLAVAADVPTGRCEFLCHVASARALAHDMDRARDLLALAQTLADQVGPTLRAEVYKRRAEVALWTNQLEEAARLVERSSALIPDEPLVIFHRAVIAHVRGRLEEAVEHGLRALRVYERLGDGFTCNMARTLIGLSQVELGRLDEAEDHLRVVLATGAPGDADLVRAAMGLALVWAHRGRLAEALAQVESVVDPQPPLVDGVTLVRAELLGWLGRSDEALADLARVRPSNRDAPLVRGELHLLRGELAEARAALEEGRGLEGRPSARDDYDAALAQVLARLGRAEEVAPLAGGHDRGAMRRMRFLLAEAELAAARGDLAALRASLAEARGAWPPVAGHPRWSELCARLA